MAKTAIATRLSEKMPIAGQAGARLQEDICLGAKLGYESSE